MYALDNVKITSVTQYDLSDIPAHIMAAMERYMEAAALVSDYYPERSTAAQKRTRTIRFNKVCGLCEAAGISAPSVLFRVTSQKLAERYK